METRQIPLDCLIFAGSEEAVRVHGINEGIGELSKNIEEFGLLVPLLVKPDTVDGDRGLYIVVDGNRRLLALKGMNGAGADPARLVTCVVGTAEELGHGAALSANVMRQAMHPLDEYDVFSKLLAAGKKVTKIAQIFGVKKKQVEQRLALASLHPNVKERLRHDKISWETAQALTLIKNMEEQVAVLTECGDSHWKIRQRLTDKRPDMKWALFTAEAYKARGGGVMVDLFEENDDEAISDTPEIWWQMQQEQIDLQIKELMAQGWAQVIKCDRQGYRNDAVKRIDVTNKKKRKQYVAGYSIFPNGRFLIHDMVEPTTEKRKADKKALKELAAPATKKPDYTDGRPPAKEITGEALKQEINSEARYTDHDLLIIIRNMLEKDEWNVMLCGKIAELLEDNGIEITPNLQAGEDEEYDAGIDPERADGASRDGEVQ